MEYANIINIARFCTDDGPGIRTTVFLKGCPLHCAWCHNPESQHSNPDILWDSKICSNCGACIRVCTTGAHSMDKGKHHFNPKKCVHCGNCANVCPTNALELSGRYISTAEVFEEISKDAIFYQTSGGGATISGGEPFVHPEFTAELLRLCKEAGIHTTIETSGYTTKSILNKVHPYCNLILFDIKETDSARHIAFTGVPLEPILSNLRYLDNLGINTLLRCPIIPGWNDREEHLLAIKNIRASLQNCLGIQIMPYHNLGAYKYQKMQIPYLCADVCEPTADTVAYWRSIAE